MSMLRSMKRKNNELLETYKKNYKMMAESRQEYYHKNIELQKEIIELKKELDKYKSSIEIEIAPSVEQGNKIVKEILKQQEIEKSKEGKTNG